MRAAGVEVLVEVGPGGVLTGLALQTARDWEGVTSLRGVRETGGDGERLAWAVARLWVAGVVVDWGGYYAGQRRRRVELPTYPFERQRYWIERRKDGLSALLPKDAATPAQAHAPGWSAEMNDWLFRLTWKPGAALKADPAREQRRVHIGVSTPRWGPAVP